MKRMLALLIALGMICAALPALAAEPVYFDGWTKEIIEGYYTSDSDIAKVIKNRATYDSIGAQYLEPVKEDFNISSPALYIAKLQANISIYAEKDTASAHVVNARDYSFDVEVLYVGTFWCVVRYNGLLGYSKREKLSDFIPVAPNTMPYGVQKHAYVAKTAKVTYVRIGMSHDDPYWVVLKPDTTLTIWKLMDGWAIVNYQRCYGYIDLNDLTDLLPVSPTDTPLTAETPIAAYTSYYGMAQTASNLSRLVNIQVACDFLTGYLLPGETYNCNKIWGPYNAKKGYEKAIVLYEGESVAGYGGGTCQVSSTIYNALIQLPGVEIINRHAHGPSGAAYLPHGVDAAVGDDAKQLNLIFKNNYDFPIRIEALSNDDGALCMLVYRATEEEAAIARANLAAAAE